MDRTRIKTARQLFPAAPRITADRIVAFLAAIAVACAATGLQGSGIATDSRPVQLGTNVSSADCSCCPPCDSPLVPPPGRAGAAEVRPEGVEPTWQPPAGVSDSAVRPGDGADVLGDAARSLPSGLGAVAAAESPAVHMIGDFFSSGYFLGGMDGFASVPAAGGDRRFKTTDNISPLPQDRVFLNYHHFHNAVSDVAGATRSVDRFTLGLERTFLNEMMSFEVRLPFTSGLDNTQMADGEDTISAEFGNIALMVKALWCERRSIAFTSGLAIVLPTAADASVEGTPVSATSTWTVLENQAVHMQPYLGVNYSPPCSRLFSTAYMAVDVDLNGNALSTGTRSVGGPTTLSPLGDVRDQTLLFFDWQVGYWLYQDFGHIGYLNGIAPVFEVHYSRALEDPVDVGGVYQNPFGKADLVNLTAGLVFDIRRAATLTVYGAAPLRREEAVVFGRPVSPVFSAEFGAQCVFRY